MSCCVGCEGVDGGAVVGAGDIEMYGAAAGAELGVAIDGDANGD
jgi:hypothetical protein